MTLTLAQPMTGWLATANYPTCDQCGAELGYAEAHDGDGICDVCRMENDPFTGIGAWTESEIEADAAHVAELVECGDLCGLGIPFKYGDSK